MRILKVFTVGLLIALFAAQAPSAFAQFTDILKSVKKAVGISGGELSESKIIEGLKEALEIGTGNAAGLVSKLDGYYKNPKIKIPLPESVQKVEKILRKVGFGSKVDDFEMSMNRAAEKAAPEAKALFTDTIKQMSIDDARKILNGNDNAATLYFKDKTWDRLYDKFKPIVNSTMSEVGTTRYYQDLDKKVRSIPFADSMSFDLDKYVTDGALDGLFYMVAQEEQKIRQNPAARVTDLLKEVFGGKR
jgi:RNA binding exosome subunit